MITLIEAFKLCGIRNDEIVHLRDAGADRWCSTPFTGFQVRYKLDMKNTKVVAINARFTCGEYEGFEFEIAKWRNS